ncbi:MAG: hypothetical protein LW860_12490 [Xanthomonadaceae bacterium]|jgi:hypothetical protein|nr:hypothetical protein [Xanthomonadaceae bacterium]
MGSLAHCLRKHESRLRPGDAAYVEALAAEHEKRGLSPSAAAQAAVLDAMCEELDTSRDIVRQIEAKGGVVPDDFRAAVDQLARTIAKLVLPTQQLEVRVGMTMKDLRRRQGFSEASFYLWRSKFGNVSVS